VAPVFLQQLGVEANRRWLDVGCGTGVLTRAILRSAAPASIVGVDPTVSFLGRAASTITDASVTLRPGTAADTGLASASVDVVVFGLVLNNVPDVAAALAEARRVAVPDGLVAGYVWDYADRMQLVRAFWDAAVALDPDAASYDQRTTVIARPAALATAFISAGLSAVETGAIEIPTTFRDFDDLWVPFTRGTGNAPTYLATLDDARRRAIRDHLRSSVPIGPDGSIHLMARAWTCRGRS
jgi:SAM-dependent methyltransferase